jgi:chromosome segregation ATPase
MEELMEETTCLQKKLIETEIQLATLHADVYTYREEIRKLRLSLSELQPNHPLDTEKIRKKKQKLEQALERLYRKINKKYQRKQEEPRPIFLSVFFLLLMGGTFFFLGRTRK